MAIFHDQNEPIFNLSLDETGRAYLLESVRWTKFLAILGFIVVGLMLLGGISIIATRSLMGTAIDSGVLSTGIISVVYMLMAFLYFYPVYCLYKFSTLIKPAIISNNQAQFNKALWHQRNMFKFLGILTILLLVLYAVLIVFLIATSAMKM